MTHSDVLPELDLSAVAWSRRGSYMTLSTNVGKRDHPGRDHDIEAGLYLCDVSGARLWRWNGVFRLRGLVGDVAVEPTIESARADLLVLGVGDGRIEITWDGTNTMRMRAHGAGIRLEQSVIDPLDAALAFPRSPDSWRLQMGEDAHYVVTRISGELSVDAPRVRTGAADTLDRKVVDARPHARGTVEIALTQYEAGYAAPEAWRPFDECRADVAAELMSWLSRFAAVDDEFRPTARAAAALLWSNTVAPRGIQTRSGVLMSKNWMNAIWSWDNCFVALGLAVGDPGLAWDQFLVVFDHQHRDGMLPDIVHDNGRMWGFCKPPVHGWTLRALLAAGAVPEDGLEQVYPPLVAWTDWWFRFRDDDGDGLCEYFHGCDSGQDNSAAFDAVGFPAAAPDLAAYLVIQMDVLADIAARLGRQEESRAWSARADAHLDLFLGRLWDGDRFVVRRGGDDVTGRSGMSQLFVLPMLLGARLPDAVRECLVSETLANLTEHGVASESPSSTLYEPDGYWRGPIWAPTTYIVTEGLRACGHPDLADDVGLRFLRTCRDGGFAENFDALSGAPLRDGGYSWTAAVALVLAGEFARSRGEVG
ncbi:amylo-alpha-1,6-glucosidase [Kineosporia sp. A_224]|uniref:amylo-alpha-1,6-glucosidase n=1 Tax=Kineosporia sp. A_224 TaxID=1962180 RepID=UPI000B4A621F|nr:trehalase family glycosidase [Kineosporia sp. A_224]